MPRPVFPIFILILLGHLASGEISLDSCSITPKIRASLRAQVWAMFDHAYSNYRTHAFPLDELCPLSCSGIDSLGGLSASLIDTLDTHIVMRNFPEFVHSARYLRDSFSFDRNVSVSVFETTIRILGGLLSAHTLLTDGASDAEFDAWLWYPSYDDALLYLAVDLADRLLPAFDTPTGIPLGTINLRYGVAANESRIASTAAAGSLLLEFGTLSALVNDRRYYDMAFTAMVALHNRAAPTGLVGNHIDVDTGLWVAHEAGIGGLIDSFYEYMLKGYVLFGDGRLYTMFSDAYPAVLSHLHHPPWYFPADMDTAHTTSFEQTALSAFWPGLQSLIGHLDPAMATTRAHYAVWRRYGVLPEGFDARLQRPIHGRANYPLRPELAEAVFYHHWATGDPSWIGVARSIMFSLETVARTPCGYARIGNAKSHIRDDLMDSFFMAETLKYLYVTFADESHWLRSGRFVLTTEAHPLRVRPVPFSVPSLQVTRNGSPKCPRRRNVDDRASTCGFGMPGTDFPHRARPRERALPADITSLIRQHIEMYGDRFRPGDTFVGRNSAYVVVRFGVHLTLAPLGGAALRKARGQARESTVRDMTRLVAERERSGDRKGHEVCQRVSTGRAVLDRFAWEVVRQCRSSRF